MTEAFNVATSRHGTRARIVVAGEIDLATAPQLQDEIDLAALEAETIVVDLRRVTFVDCAALRVLLLAALTLGERLSIIPSKPLLRLAKIAGAQDCLPLAGANGPEH